MNQTWKYYKRSLLLDNGPLILMSVVGAAWVLVIIAALLGWIR